MLLVRLSKLNTGDHRTTVCGCVMRCFVVLSLSQSQSQSQSHLSQIEVQGPWLWSMEGTARRLCLAAGCRCCGRLACQGLFCLGYICILARPSRHPSLSLSSRGALPSTDMPRTDQDPELRFAVQTRGCDQQTAPCASSASRRGTWLAPGGGYSNTMHAYSVL